MSSLRKTRAVVASLAEAEAAADDLLRKGNALDAVVAGVFAACAVAPGVLLGPVQILVGGGGAGLRAYDGRVRQPGIGAPRPRGFQSGEDIPNAARVGVPWLPATLSVAVATAGTATFAQVMAPGIELAKGTPRGEVLEKIAGRGPRALEERPLSSELLAYAGRPSGGLLTSEDLASPHPEVFNASRFEVAGPPSAAAASAPAPAVRGKRPAGANVRSIFTLPWAHVEDASPVTPVGTLDVAPARGIAAVDRHGMFAIAVWDEGIDGLNIPELGLRAPFFAQPVRRGVTRVRPTEVLPAAAPIALVGGPGGPEVAFAAFGARDAYDVLREAIRGLVQEERIEAHGEARLVAVAQADGSATSFR